MSAAIDLYMFLLGCKPPGRLTEQHDIFFGIGPGVASLVPHLREFWPEAGNKLHIDAWRPVTRVDGFRVAAVSRDLPPDAGANRLFFINLGGYKPGEFDEFHYRMLVVAPDKGVAIRRSKETAFYRHTGFKGAQSHVDDKYGVDVDDLYDIQDTLPPAAKERYRLQLTPVPGGGEDRLRLGYFQLQTLQDLS
ncbi:MAG TPA: DUF1543 domain-containing protein [Puia sp.]|nr:DUF1543 domain-containing protein [Puia sp.]